jgi:hypothetical protein
LQRQRYAEANIVNVVEPSRTLLGIKVLQAATPPSHSRSLPSMSGCCAIHDIGFGVTLICLCRQLNVSLRRNKRPLASCCHDIHGGYGGHGFSVTMQYVIAPPRKAVQE